MISLSITDFSTKKNRNKMTCTIKRDLIFRTKTIWPFSLKMFVSPLKLLNKCWPDAWVPDTGSCWEGSPEKPPSFLGGIWQIRFHSERKSRRHRWSYNHPTLCKNSTGEMWNCSETFLLFIFYFIIWTK